MAEAIPGNLKEIGIKVNVQMVEQIDAELQQNNWDGAMYFVTMGLSGDPYLNLSQYFNTGGSANFGGYSSLQVDDLTRQLSVAADRQTREHLACAAIIDDIAVVPLLYPNHLFGVSRKVVGFENPHPFAWYFMDSQIGIE
jgi:ABC-type transport system substrate-binding protein